MRTIAVLAWTLLLTVSAHADEEPPKPPPAPAPADAPSTPEQVADAVRAAAKANDDAALKTLAAQDDPDPWRVADELVHRGEHDAADRFAKAAPRKDVERLPAYVASRRGAPPDAEARKALDEVSAALGSGRWSDALERIEAATPGGTTVVGVRLAFGRGAGLAGAGRLGDAAAAFGRAAEAAEALGWLAAASEGRHEAGAAAEAAGDLAAAAASFEAALTIDGARGRTDARAPTLLRLGRLLLRLRAFEKAVGVLEQAVEGFQALDDPKDLGNALGNLGSALARLRRWPEALSATERALAVFEARGHREAQAATLANIVLLEQSRGESARARDACVRWLAVLESAGDAAGVTRARLMLGGLEQSVGDYAAALAIYRRALEEARSRGDEASIAVATSGLGGVQASRGEYAAALSTLERAKGMYEALGDRSRAATTQRSLAGVQYLLGQHEAALASYEGALAVFEALGETAKAAQTLNSLGNVQEALGAPEEALASYQRALEMQEALGNRAEVANVLSNIGTLEAPPAAIATFERAQALFEALGDRAGAARVLSNLGLAQAQLGAHAEALRTLERARPALDEVGDRLGAARALGAIGLAHLGLKETAKALDDARRAVREASVLATGLGAEEGVGARDELEMLYEVGVQAAVAANDPAELAFFLESGRAGALLEGLRAQPLLWSATVPPELREAEAKARAAATAAASALTVASSSGDLAAIRAARAALATAQERVSAAVARIQREAKAGAAIVAPEAASLAEIRRTLADGDVLVIYGEVLGDLLALVATKADARIVRLGDTALVQDAAAGLPLADADADPAAALEQMRRLAVDPLGLDPKASRVLVSPTGALAYVPFATLLGDRDVVLVPSGTTYRLLLEDAATRGAGVLALGDPDYRGRTGLAPLPATGVEARAIGDVVLTGKDATERGLRAALAGRSRWRAVHLACHGLVDVRYPMRSSLAVTAAGDDDGLLSAVDVFSTRTPADLVVLSACETGRGRDYRAEGMVGLMRAFMFAGAPRVICSLWKVDDEATRALMVKFYELWNPKDGKPGLPTAEALRKAQAFVRSQAPWKHPYYWAAWVLWGLPE